jgi:membrane fusion protein, multidrug efflux system
LANQANNGKAETPASRRNLIIPIALVLTVGIGYGIYWLAVVRGTVYTDDAQTHSLLVPCSSRVGGRVVEVLAWEGQRVSKGQVLARLDEMPYRAQRDQAQAAVAAARTQLNSAELNHRRMESATTREVAMAQAELKSAEAKEALARKERDRFDNVKTWVPEETVDQFHTAYRSSESALTVAKNKLRLLTRHDPEAGDTTAPPREVELKVLSNQLELARANLALAQAQLDLAESNFAEIEVKAMSDGVISRRHVDPGQVVSSGQKLFSITAANSLWIEANFEEGDIAEVRPGDPATIKADAYPGRKVIGHVESVLPASLSTFSLLPSGASSGNFIKVTQRVPVCIAVEGQDLPYLFPGLNVEVRVTVSGERAAQTSAAPAASAPPARPPAPAPAAGSTASVAPAPGATAAAPAPSADQ